MEEYLECIGLFYNEKVKAFTVRDKFMSCKGCDTSKEFKETSNEVSLSCGEEGTGNCGMRLNVKFPRYLKYENEIVTLKKKLEEGVNLSALNKYINVDVELNKRKSVEEDIKKEIEKIESKVYKINKETKKKRIQTFYDNRIKLQSDCQSYLKKLKDTTIDRELRKDIYRKYNRNIQTMNSEYIEIKEYIESVDTFLKIKEPIVSICDMDNLNTTERKKKVKKEKGDKEVKYHKSTIGKIVKQIVSCNGYKSKDQLIELWGEIGEGNLNLDPLYELVKKELILKKKNWREKEDPPIVQASIQKYISGYKLFKNNLTDKDCKKDKKKKTRPPLDKKEDKLIELLLDKLYENEGKLTKEEYNKITKNNFQTKWGKPLFNSLQGSKSTHPWKEKLQEKIGNIIKEPTNNNESQDYIELTEMWIEYLTFIKSKDKSKEKEEKEEKEENEDEFFEPEPEPEPEPLLEIEPEESEELYTPKSIDEIEEGLKIKWTSEDGKVLDGHIDIIDKMMKKNINIIIYDEGEIKLKVPLSDIKVIR